MAWTASGFDSTIIALLKLQGCHSLFVVKEELINNNKSHWLGQIAEVVVDLIGARDLLQLFYISGIDPTLLRTQLFLFPVTSTSTSTSMCPRTVFTGKCEKGHKVIKDSDARWGPKCEQQFCAYRAGVKAEGKYYLPAPNFTVKLTYVVPEKDCHTCKALKSLAAAKEAVYG